LQPQPPLSLAMVLASAPQILLAAATAELAAAPSTALRAEHAAAAALLAALPPSSPRAADAARCAPWPRLQGPLALFGHDFALARVLDTAGAELAEVERDERLCALLYEACTFGGYGVRGDAARNALAHCMLPASVVPWDEVQGWELFEDWAMKSGLVAAVRAAAVEALKAGSMVEASRTPTTGQMRFASEELVFTPILVASAECDAAEKVSEDEKKTLPPPTYLMSDTLAAPSLRLDTDVDGVNLYSGWYRVDYENHDFSVDEDSRHSEGEHGPDADSDDPTLDNQYNLALSTNIHDQIQAYGLGDTEYYHTAQLVLHGVSSSADPKPSHHVLRFEIPFEELSFVRKVGEGAFAEVWEGTWLHSPVAIKRFHGSKAASIGPEDDCSSASFRTGFTGDTPGLPYNAANLMYDGPCLNGNSNTDASGDALDVSEADIDHDVSESTLSALSPSHSVGLRRYAYQILTEHDSDPTRLSRRASSTFLRNFMSDASRQRYSSFLREARVLSSLRHPHVLLYSALWSPTSVFLHCFGSFLSNILTKYLFDTFSFRVVCCCSGCRC
jgi:hypothetical protein